ncbi:MAG: peptide chain release factor N(5)-glutamine methyltransferase [Flavobacteriaceae bacterium]|nr:peptide chain release factor N(5)-glutamine methyltransferase [Flavobacteriaceae bacterium]
MDIKTLKSTFMTGLSDVYPASEISSFLFLLIEKRLRLTRIDLALQPNLEITLADKKYFLKALSRLIKNEPIQYIIGTTEFYNLTFRVDKNVLIPRPETEELVSWILNEVGRQKSKDKSSIKEEKNALTTDHKRQTTNILDIGTGSGCIAIALAKNIPQAHIWALDVSKEALKIAQQNATLNKVNINFIELDILEANTIVGKPQQSHPNKETDTATSHLSKDVKFDIIVSNPPYVRQLEKVEIKDNVLKHEPHLALFVDDNNPLLFYDKIADFTKKYLKGNGDLFFEINQNLAKEVCSLLKDKGFNKRVLKKDLFGVDRMIRAANKS